MSQDHSPHIADVTRQAGPPVATVSNVLKWPERVSPATDLRAEAAIVELTSVRNGSAHLGRGAMSRLIGTMVTDLRDDFQLKVAQQVEAAAAAAGRMTLHSQTLGRRERELAYLDFFHQRGAAGVIVGFVGDVTAQLLQMERVGIANVVVSPSTPTPCPSVGVDEEAGGLLAANHLIDQGCRRLAFVGSGLKDRPVARRLAGAAMAASSRGAQLEVLADHASSVAVGATVGTSIASRPSNRPDGIITTSDSLAVGIVHSLASHGVSVPADIAVVGWGDTDFAGSAPIPLSSVRQPAAAIGAMAFELLRQQIEQTTVERPGGVLDFFPDLIARKSSLRA
jgi:LacI family transcriptional regulator, galactose operon repressor